MNKLTGIFAAASLGVTALALSPVARADVTLPSLLSEHAVLQRSDHTRIWGNAAAGETVRVSLGGVQAQTAAGGEGKWEVSLDVSRLGEGPFELVVEGKNRLVVSDVLIGEVWLSSGQSNMAYSLNRSTGGAEEISRSANRRLRQFTVSYNPIAQPQERCKGIWMVADPATSANFSAVSYYFAKDLQHTLNTPVGIVRSAWAGTAIMSWISENSISAEPELKAINDLAMQRVADYPKLKQAYVSSIADWEAKTGRQDRPGDPAAFASVGVEESQWKKVSLHNTKFKAIGLPDAGAVWLRTTVDLPAVPPAGQNLSISLIIGAFDQTYWNGKKIGEMTEATSPGPSALRFYKIPREACNEGTNIIAVRVFTPTETASFGSGYVDAGVKRIPLAGPWLAKTEFELPPLADKTYPQLPGAPGISPCALYNGMINPLTPGTFAGVLWYQGEQDTGRKGAQYQKMLQTLIGDWRARFGTPLPFILCQLPNFGKKTTTPGNSTWAEIREAQRRALEIPGTSLVTLIDVGEEDVHPPQKQPVGQRMALSALATVYGKRTPYCGPLYDAMKIEGNRAIISFRFAESGLVAKPLPADYLPTYSAKENIPLVRNSPGSDLEGFAICSADNKWVWAQAKIEGNTVVVWSPAVSQPIAVRYAWADNPTCNLYNGDGLPASPFQTRNPAVSENQPH